MEAIQLHPVEYLFKLDRLDRVKFISIRNYQNKEGEISNYVLIAAFDYERARAKDIARLESVSYEGLKEVARREMLNALLRNAHPETRSNASQAQIDAYRHLGMNSKIHVDTKSIKIWAFLRRKNVITPVVYKPVNKHAKTVLKDQIAKELRLSTRNYRMFTLDNVQCSVVNSEHIELVN